MMWFKTKKYTYIAPALLGIILFSPSALATTDGSTIEPVEKSLETLVTIRDDDTLPEAEKAQKELDARKAVLKEALALSLQETKDLIAGLEALSFIKDSKEAGMQDAFEGALHSYAAYYEQEIAKAEDIASIADVKALAQDIKAYRETIHNPNVQRIVDFLLLSRNENILSVARSRHTKITADIRKLEKKGFIEAGSFDNNLTEARLDLDDAAALYTNARKLVLAVETAEKTDGVSVEKAPTAREEIGASFDKIKSAYNIFLDISKNVRATLGIE